MFDLETLIKTGGYLGLFAIIFAETGLLVGFFLPGDSLLFTAGILASQGYLNIAILLATFFAAAVLGDNTGYFIGHKFGKKLFRKEDSLLFHKEHLARAKNFYEKHGRKTIIIARFMPIIRTFSAVVAGIGDMPYLTFLTFDVVGGFLWAVGIPLLGYFLGNVIPDIDKFLLPIIALIIFFSVFPGLRAMLKTKEQREKILVILKSLSRKN
ncbi:VTT domain-containing protein [Candidatus Gottesmanbacteria bacterium]|nr:VTT domain-containing protein [Candidatus Gottesmanbacteria bacterium]